MKNKVLLLIGVALITAGCATDPGRVDLKNDRPLIQLPLQDESMSSSERAPEEIAFKDVSLSMKKRTTILTNRTEIEKETNNFVDNGQADVITRPDGTILFPYGLAQVLITSKKMMYSKIVLQEGEKILSAAAGDTVRWHIVTQYIGDANSYTPVVLIKPFNGGLQTSLSIVTDKRDYDIVIRSVDSGDYLTRVGFYYPQDKADAVVNQAPPDRTENNESLKPKIDIENITKWKSISGDKTLKWFPKEVFDDGQKLFIKMPSNVSRSELPVFMSVNSSGQSEVVNYRYFRPYFVVDTIVDKGVLVLGSDKYQKIVKISKR